MSTASPAASARSCSTSTTPSTSSATTSAVASTPSGPGPRPSSGRRASRAAAWEHFLAGGRGDAFDVVLRGAGIDPTPATVAAMVECYRDHRPRITMLPDAVALVDGLQGRVELAAVTDGPLASQRAKVEALGVAEWARVVVFTEEFGPGFAKPHPRAFELIEAHVGTRGSDNVYLADNPAKDFAAPRALGWRTVRVRRPESLHAGVVSGADVDLEVTDLTEAARLLGFGAARVPRR